MTRTTITTAEYNTCIELIASAERDLGKLSGGQCRDLLMDNTAHDSDTIRAVVQVAWGVSPAIAGLEIT